MEQGKFDVFHVHRIHPDTIRAVRKEHFGIHQDPPDDSVGKKLYGDVIMNNRTARFITLVREPIARNISAFFQNFTRFTGHRLEKPHPDPEELVSFFFQNYRHTIPLTWFDAEIKKTLGIDVFDHPFPAEKGYQFISWNKFELLILKLETKDTVKEKAIKSFLGLEQFTLRKRNTANKKKYSKIYRDFLEHIRFPREYIDAMYESAYAKHFYTTDEIHSFRKKWNISNYRSIRP
jgi:hypothetical protein